jgi:hypothetical protein
VKIAITSITADVRVFVCAAVENRVLKADAYVATPEKAACEGDAIQIHFALRRSEFPDCVTASLRECRLLRVCLTPVESIRIIRRFNAASRSKQQCGNSRKNPKVVHESLLRWSSALLEFQDGRLKMTA